MIKVFQSVILLLTVAVFMFPELTKLHTFQLVTMLKLRITCMALIINVYDEFIYDLTFVKLRELSIGYNIPVDKLGMSKNITGLNVSVIAQNPWLIYSSTRDFDPSEISAAHGESGQFPGIRSFGINVKVTF